MSRFWIVAALISALLPATPALAYDWVVVGKVTQVEGTYMPTQLPFQIDSPGGNCPAGSQLLWNLQGTDTALRSQNAQAALALLLTAKSTGQSITVYGNNAGCTIDFLLIR